MANSYLLEGEKANVLEIRSDILGKEIEYMWGYMWGYFSSDLLDWLV